MCESEQWKSNMFSAVVFEVFPSLARALNVYWDARPETERWDQSFPTIENRRVDINHGRMEVALANGL